MKQKICLLIILMSMLCAAPVVAAGSVKIIEWQIPPADKFPHDPAVGQGNSLWFTGMGSNTLGRLDVINGQFRSYPLKNPDSGPHGLVSDSIGNIWFTANFKGYIGRLDPKDGTVTEFLLSDRAAHDPHSLVFDKKGVLWFTVQQGNFVGRLEPATGKVLLKSLRLHNSLPYGIAVNSKGIPFFCEFGANRIGRIDPVTMTITEYQLPKGARPRRISITSDDMVWYTDYRRGYLGQLDPQTGRVAEWESPGGRNAAPYGLTVTPDNTVWYSESGVKPNTIVHFNPSTKKFTSWPVPSGGGVIRNMAATSQGDIYFACSGVNKVGIIQAGR